MSGCRAKRGLTPVKLPLHNLAYCAPPAYGRIPVAVRRTVDDVRRSCVVSKSPTAPFGGIKGMSGWWLALRATVCTKDKNKGMGQRPTQGMLGAA